MIRKKPITRSLFSERVDTIVYTEKGTLHCILPCNGVNSVIWPFKGLKQIVLKNQHSANSSSSY